MCRTGGRRCPSSRTRANGGTRGRSRPAAGPQGDTPGGQESGVTFTGPVSLGGGQVSDGDLTITAHRPGDTSRPADTPGRDGQDTTTTGPFTVGGVTFAGGVSFGPGAKVSFDGAPVAGGRVRYYPPRDTGND